MLVHNPYLGGIPTLGEKGIWSCPLPTTVIPPLAQGLTTINSEGRPEPFTPGPLKLVCKHNNYKRIRLKPCASFNLSDKITLSCNYPPELTMDQNFTIYVKIQKFTFTHAR
jgi:hypothetical protein